MVNSAAHPTDKTPACPLNAKSELSTWEACYQSEEKPMKNIPQWSAEEAKVFLQAMNEVGRIGGVVELEPISLDLIHAVQTHVLHSAIDLASLEIIHPPAYADLLPDPAKRFQLIQILILM